MPLKDLTLKAPVRLKGALTLGGYMPIFFQKNTRRFSNAFVRAAYSSFRIFNESIEICAPFFRAIDLRFSCWCTMTKRTEIGRRFRATVLHYIVICRISFACDQCGLSPVHNVPHLVVLKDCKDFTRQMTLRWFKSSWAGNLYPRQPIISD